MQKTATNFIQDMVDTEKLPVHEIIYRRLRDMVLFGDLKPGQAVTIQGLTSYLNAGMTPVREAIRRLISQGALEFQGNRRVSVPVLGEESINEIIIARQWLDPYMTLRAAQNATFEDIAALAKVDDKLDHAITSGDLRAYLELNYQFHRKIYDIAKAPILKELAEGIWLKFGPSMRVVCGRIGTQNLPDRHKEALDAMRAKDAESAARAIREDVLQGMEQLLRSFREPDISSGLD